MMYHRVLSERYKYRFHEIRKKINRYTSRCLGPVPCFVIKGFRLVITHLQ